MPELEYEQVKPGVRRARHVETAEERQGRQEAEALLDAAKKARDVIAIELERPLGSRSDPWEAIAALDARLALTEERLGIA